MGASKKVAELKLGEWNVVIETSWRTMLRYILQMERFFREVVELLEVISDPWQNTGELYRFTLFSPPAIRRVDPREGQHPHNPWLRQQHLILVMHVSSC